MAADRSVQPQPHPFLPPEPLPAERRRLQNGIPCLLWRQQDYELVRMDIRVRAGSWFQQQPGVASATLKMLLEGTVSHPGVTWQEMLDAEGAYVESVSDRDFASISLHFPNRAASKVLPLVREMLTEPQFSYERLQLLKMQQKQSLAVNLEKNSYVAYRNFLSEIYTASHPYGRSLSVEDTDGWERAMLTDYFKARYVTSAFRVFMAGNLTPETIRLLEQTLGTLEQRPLSCDAEYPLSPSAPVRKRMKGSGNLQSSICVGRLLFNRNHPDWMRASLYNRLLGGYFGSRLMTEIRERQGLAYGIYSHLCSQQHAGHFHISADVNADQAGLAEERIMEELRLLCREEVPQHELERVKKYEAGALLRNFDGLFPQMEQGEETDDYGLDATWWPRYFQAVTSVTAGELREIAQSFFAPEQMTVVRVEGTE